MDLEAKIAIKAIKDPEFKKKLLQDPKKALKELFKNEKNFNIDALHIHVTQEKKGEWIIPLPLIEHSESLSEKDLKNLAAGILDLGIEDYDRGYTN